MARSSHSKQSIAYTGTTADSKSNLPVIVLLEGICFRCFEKRDTVWHMTDIWISQGHQLAPRTYDRRGWSDFLLGGRRRNCRLLVVVRHPSSKCQLGKAGKMRKTRDIVDDKGAATSTSCPVNTVVQRWKLTDKIKKKSTRQHVPLNITRIDSVR